MTKIDVRAIVTEKIITGLESGVIPWRQPWQQRGMAVSHANGKFYRGLNQFVLTLVAQSNGWVNRWLTFKQLAGKGWKLRKGEHGVPISYFTWIEDEDDNTRFPLLRYYTVFSLSQLEELPELPAVVEHEFSVIDRAEKLISKYTDRPSVSFGGDSASYSPTNDTISMPLANAFISDEAYYCTYFHELGHSTGHEKRLARKGIVEFDRFGSAQYGLEELVAEFTSAFLCAESGIDQPVLENSTGYIQNWLSVLKNDRQMLLSAASQAQKSADYIMGVTFGKVEE